MEKLKKTILYISGPGVLFVEIIAVFVQLFTSANTKPWIIGGLLVFFIVFLPLYSIEYFRQNFKNERNKKAIQFRKKKTRKEWGGGNIHGKIPIETDRPGKMFNG